VRGLLAALALAVATSGAAGRAQDRPAPAATPLDPETLALANQVVDLAFPPETRHAMSSRVIDAMLAQTREATAATTGHRPDAGEQQILDRYMERLRADADRIVTESSPSLYAAFARGYARLFTRDELIQIRAFVSTPAGAKYVQRSSELLSDPDVAAANTAYLRNVFTAFQPLQSQLRDELIAYHQREAGPPSPRPTPARRR
jgi:hypothetical protein